MKTCPKCHVDLPLTSFGKNAYYCKPCSVRATQARQKTLKGLVKKIYHNQKMTTGKAGRPAPTYTETELFDWMMAHGLQLLWETWTASGHLKALSPSIDRKDNSLSYTLNNIQLVTWEDNFNNANTHYYKGIMPNKVKKKVDQLDLEGNFIQTFPSAACAGRAMIGNNKSISNITGVCHGKAKSAYGYKWRFHEGIVLI